MNSSINYASLIQDGYCSSAFDLAFEDCNRFGLHALSMFRAGVFYMGLASRCRLSCPEDYLQTKRVLLWVPYLPKVSKGQDMSPGAKR